MCRRKLLLLVNVCVSSFAKVIEARCSMAVLGSREERTPRGTTVFFC
jgi:hypothetical protein